MQFSVPETELPRNSVLSMLVEMRYSSGQGGPSVVRFLTGCEGAGGGARPVSYFDIRADGLQVGMEVNYEEFYITPEEIGVTFTDAFNLQWNTPGRKSLPNMNFNGTDHKMEVVAPPFRTVYLTMTN